MKKLTQKLQIIQDAILDVEAEYSENENFKQLPSDLRKALWFVSSELWNAENGGEMEYENNLAGDE